MKKIIFVSLIVCSFSIFNGCGEQADEQTTVDMQETVPATTTEVDEQVETPVEATTLSDEELMEDNQKLDALLSEDSDLSACDELKDAHNRRVCRVDVITSQAMTSSDKSVCDQLEYTEDKERCINKVPETTLPDPN